MKITPTIQDKKINPESIDLMPTVPAALATVDDEEVIGVVQVAGVVALDSIRKYHFCTIFINVPGIARDTPGNGSHGLALVASIPGICASIA